MSQNLPNTVAECRARLVEVSDELDRLGDLPNPTNGDAERCDRLVKYGERLQEQIAKIDRQNERDAIEAAKSATGVESGYDTRFNVNLCGDPWEEPLDRARPTELEGRAATAIERTNHGSEAARQHITETLVEGVTGRDGTAKRQWSIAASAPNYKAAYDKLLCGRSDLWSDAERQAVMEADHVRAMSLTDASGGFAVPEVLSAEVALVSDGATNPIRQIARVETGVSDTLRLISSTGTSASWDSEAEEASDDSPTYVSPTISPHRMTMFIPYSIELELDYKSGMLGEELTRMFVDEKDQTEAAAFATGSGSGEPKGIVTAAAANTNSVVTMQTNSSVSIADLYAAYEAVPSRFRSKSSWLANIAIIDKVRQLSDDSFGNETVPLTSAGIPALLGLPFYEASSMDGTLSTSTSSNIVLGSFDHYCIYDRLPGLVVERVNHLIGTSANRPTGQRGAFAFARIGADAIGLSATTTPFILSQNPA